jgi:hypothetical protein
MAKIIFNDRYPTRCILVYKNFSSAVSHIGLGVSAGNTCKVLEREGIHCEVWPAQTAAELKAKLEREFQNPYPISHVVVSAPWIPILDWQSILQKWHRIHFAVNVHSNIGFLQADSNGVANMAGCVALEKSYPNFRLSANNRTFGKWINDTHACPCQYLPNLYYLHELSGRSRPMFGNTGPGAGGTLQIGCFGAIRPLKNGMSAAAAAIQVARSMRCKLEFWVSNGRAEGGGEGVLRAMQQLFPSGPNPQERIIRSTWAPWPEFRATIGSMHLLMQPSYTESFNMVTADGIAEGVPSVVSSAIDWVPSHWMADADDVAEIARVGRYLLTDPHAAAEGREALENYVQDGIMAWKRYLEMKKV